MRTPHARAKVPVLRAVSREHAPEQRLVTRFNSSICDHYVQHSQLHETSALNCGQYEVRFMPAVISGVEVGRMM